MPCISRLNREVYLQKKTKGGHEAGQVCTTKTDIYLGVVVILCDIIPVFRR